MANSRSMNVELGRRVWIAGVGLLIGSAGLLIGYAQVLSTNDLVQIGRISIPISLMVLVGGSAMAIPTRWREQLSHPLSVLCGVAGVVAPLALPAADAAATASAVLVTMFTVILLPTSGVLRAGILLSHAALILFCAQPPLAQWPAIAVGLALAFWLGEQQRRLLTSQHLERSRLAKKKAALEAHAVQRDAILEDRQTMLIRQAEWATLGRMATGVAHEIKNPLQAAFSDLEAVRSTGDLQMLDHVEVSLRRIDGTIREISRLRRDPTLKLRTYELRAVVDASLRSACMGLKQASVRMGDLPDLAVHCDQNLLTDAFANLVTNAAHAAQAKGRATIRVHGSMNQTHALVFVDDDGPGIPADQIEQVFEAFHTTKEAGKGTGLGLAISRKKLQMMGGDVWAEFGSTLGGARLVIALELAPSDAPRTAVNSPSRAPKRGTPNLPKIRRSSGRGAPKRHGTLLLIDDDAAVRRALTRTLKRNWNVLSAGGSIAAGKKATTERIDAVLCDMHLLQEDAIDVLAALSEVDPDLITRIVFMTGEPTSLRLLALVEANPERVLEKPFEPRRATGKLLAAMRGSLPPLRSDDLETPPSLGALDESWVFEAVTSETDPPV